MQDCPAGVLSNLPRVRRERGIDGAGRRWLFAGRIPTAWQDQRPGAVLGSACPPRLENGCCESTARFAELDRSTSSNRSGGGGTEISGLASAGCRTPESNHVQRGFSTTRLLTQIDKTATRTILPHERSLQSCYRPRHQQQRNRDRRSREWCDQDYRNR